MIAKRNGSSRGAGAGGAADAVDVALRFVGNVIVDDMRNAVDVDAASGNIGGDEDARLAIAEGGEHALALRLRLVAVERLCGDPRAAERTHQLVGAAFGAGKDDGAFHRLLPQYLGKHGGLAAAFDVDDTLAHPFGSGGDGRHRDLGRISQHVLREIGDRLGHGRGEQQGLALRRQFRDDPADVVDEAHVEHAIGFIEHQDLDPVEPQRVALHEVDEAPGRRDQHVDAVHEVTHLLAHRHAADGERGVQAEVSAIGVEAVENLAGEFARRAEHEHAARFSLERGSIGGEPMQDRKGEGGGFSGSGLGDAYDIASFEDEWNCLGLDGGGGDVVFFDKSARNRFGKAESIKRGQCATFSLVANVLPAGFGRDSNRGDQDIPRGQGCRG
jgi:hypothetical protein